MARPIKNNCDYFPHDAGMRNHKKVKALRSKFGITGYAVWSMLLEYLTGSDGNVFPYTELELELMSGDFGIPATEIRSVVDYCIILELLFSENGFIKSESLDERLAPVYEKRGKAKELSKKQLRDNGKFATNNTDEPVITVTETPQSKGKEIKGNESKENEIIPAFAEVSVWPTFEDFWDKYDKKVGKPKSEIVWKKINQGAREKIMEHLDRYGQIEKKYRKDPERYLQKECWNDEIIIENGKQGINSKGKGGITAQGTLDRLNSYS